MNTRLKVYAYIIYQDRLLVFRHTKYPEAGIQVPGGTVEPGEPLDKAVLREAEEESGLKDLRIAAYLGMRQATGLKRGKEILYIRHFYLLEPGPVTFPGGPVPETWSHFESNPSDGWYEPYEFEFCWVGRDDNPPHAFQVELAGEQGALLEKVQKS